jgi:D-glycero-beta-D-manno-heptose-7-phosphate kinase
MSLTLSRNRVDRILSQFLKKKVLVFGDVGVDKYTFGRVTRISPEAPIPIVEVYNTQLKLGLAANVADNVAALGGEPLITGVVGRDIGSQDFLKLLRASKLNSRYMVFDRKTTLKERVVAESQQVVRIDYESQQTINSKVLREILRKLETAIERSDCIIIEDYAKGLVETSLCKQLIQLAEKKNIPVLVDPNSKSPLSLYEGCTVITPNVLEAEALTGIAIKDMTSLNRAGHRILDEVNAQIVVITRGRDGMAVFMKGKSQPVLIPTFAREVFDVSGAGDTVIATLALALVSGANIIESVLLANFAAGVEVGKRGTATVSMPELKEYIELVGHKSANKRQIQEL